MSTSVYGQPGIYNGRQLTPLNIHNSLFLRAYDASFYQFDGNNARDPDNNPTSMLRPGLICGKITSSGLYANSIIGLTYAAHVAGSTSLQVTPQAGAEIQRRIGNSGSITLTGPAVTGQTVQQQTVAYSAITTGSTYYTLTITAPTVVNEIQTVTVTGSPTGGTFTLTYEGTATATIAYNATAATVATALNNMFATRGGPGASPLTAAVTGSAGGPYTVKIGGVPSGQGIDLLVLGANALTGGTTPSVTVTNISSTTTDFVANSLIGATDGSQAPLVIYDDPSHYGVDVTFTDGTAANQPMQAWLSRASLLSAQIINLTTCDAGCQSWLKQQLAGKGNVYTYDNDR